MNLIILSKEDRVSLAEMMLTVQSLRTNVAVLKQHITSGGISGSKYTGILETERDLSILCIDQIQVSLVDMDRYFRNLRSLVE